MNRREMITGAAAVVAAASIPSLPAVATTEPTLKAEMFYTTDEPWGCWVRGHVSQEQFNKATLELLDKDHDVRDNAEDWLWENQPVDEDGNKAPTITADAERGYMRLDRTDDPDLGDVYMRCKADEPGAIPITVVMF